MALQTEIREAPEHLPAPGELAELAGPNTLVLLPDSLTQVSGQKVAGFRSGTQELRVAAKEAGLSVALALPPEAKAGQYSEHAADWVLPLILSGPITVISTLVANQLQLWIDRARQDGTTRMPTARFREVVIEEGETRTTVHEVEGPADELVDWLRQRNGLARPAEEPADPDQP